MKLRGSRQILSVSHQLFHLTKGNFTRDDERQGGEAIGREKMEKEMRGKEERNKVPNITGNGRKV